MLDITNGYEVGRFVGTTVLPLTLAYVGAHYLYKYFERQVDADAEANPEKYEEEDE